MSDGRFPPVEVVITCVDYADFLRLTLPHTLRAARSVTVLTAPRDTETRRLAQTVGATVYATNSWYSHGSLFSKARALNEWLTGLGPDPERWVLVLDADIVLAPNVLAGVAMLDDRGLYGLRRRMCSNEDEWNALVDGHRSFDDFPLDEPPVVDGKVWGLPTNNPAGLCGYFQLWKPATSVGASLFRATSTAGSYDVLFGMSFPERHRALLPGPDALHIGPPRCNWSGRRTPRWGQARPLPPERIKAAHALATASKANGSKE